MQTFVKAAAGRTVREPQLLRLIPSFEQEGPGHPIEESDSFWRRRLRDGDVVLVDKDGAPLKPVEEPAAEEIVAERTLPAAQTEGRRGRNAEKED